MRSMWIFGSVVLSTAVLRAQSSPQALAQWRQFRAPDSTFVIMYHQSQPFERRTQDSGYVSEDIYTSRSGATTLSVRRQSHRTGASLRHMPSVDGFCATCLGHVVTDTTIRGGIRAGRWVLAERESPDSPLRTTLAYRLIGWGAHVYIVGAESAPGAALSPDTGWFLESFHLCVPGDACPVIDDGPPPWTTSPFRYLPPSYAATGESSSGTPDFGQAFLDYQVDEPAQAQPGSPEPTYPPPLKARGVEGEAVVTFVVDSTGHAEVPTFAVVRSTDSLFVNAVKDALPSMRFLPAMVGNKKVRQLVQLRYPFTLPH